MNGFVGRGGRAGSSLSRPQSANGKRSGANHRVPVNRTELKNETTQKHSGKILQSGNKIHHVADQLNQGQRRDSGESVNGRHDRYGTDAGSSIDTTAIEKSNIQGEGHENTHQQQYVRQGDQESDNQSEESTEEEDRSGDEDEGGQFESDSPQYDRNEVLRAYEKNGIYFNPGNSYPSTTSGPPEELNNWTAGKQMHFDNDQDDGRNLIVPSKPRKGQATHQGQPPQQSVQQTIIPHSTSRAIHMQVKTFELGAKARNDERGNTNLAMRGGGDQQPNAPPVSSQPPTHSQTVQQPSRSANITSVQRLPIPAVQIPQYGNGLSSNPARAAPSTKQVHVAPTTQPAPAQAMFPTLPQPKEEESFGHYPSIEKDPVCDPEPPREDYDIPELLNLSYDQLREESFDHVPRGKAIVLPDGMKQCSLAERLEHIQKHHDAGDQDKFFRALPTREWEDAGDWFLERFGSIIERAKEARQKKRKLAREFEDEVEKRYRHVAKKQQNVEDALGGMKVKGQSLIPKSPRASKSPAPSKIRESRKR